MGGGRLTFNGGGGSWSIMGEIDIGTTAALRDWVQRIPSELPLELDLADLEIMDSAGNSAAIEIIRLAAQHRPAVTLHHAPQLLAHALYRIGLLEAGSRIILIEPRQEEPFG